jgi:hypothetical protein
MTRQRRQTCGAGATCSFFFTNFCLVPPGTCAVRQVTRGGPLAFSIVFAHAGRATPESRCVTGGFAPRVPRRGARGWSGETPPAAGPRRACNSTETHACAVYVHGRRGQCLAGTPVKGATRVMYPNARRRGCGRCR